MDILSEKEKAVDSFCQQPEKNCLSSSFFYYLSFLRTKIIMANNPEAVAMQIEIHSPR